MCCIFARRRGPSAGISDEDLLGLVARNHLSALDELAERYLPILRSEALHILGGDELAAWDIAMEVLLFVWERRVDLPTVPVRAFLLRKARWLALNELRRRRAARRRESAYVEAMLSQPERPDHVAARAELRRSLLSAISRIPRRQRQALLLRCLDGRTFDEVGRAMQISARTAEHYVELAMVKLRTMLAHEATEWLGRAEIE